MDLQDWAESRTHELSVWDFALVKWSCLAGGVLLARLVPSVRRIDPRVLAVVTVALALKPAVTVLRAGGSRS
jgi:hypothetical protein